MSSAVRAPMLVKELITKVYMEGRKFLLEPEAKSICAKYGIPVTKSMVAHTSDEAVDSAEKLGYPVVLKIVSPDVIHKSDVGGVKVGIQNPEDVGRSYVEILESVKKKVVGAKIAGVLVQEMVPPTTEVIVGAIKDPQFGPAVMFGLGGVFVELLKDVTFRIAPVTLAEALEMITEVKAYPLLRGYRNTPPVDVDAIAGIIVSTSTAVMENPQIKELDLNPVMVYEKGAKVVDARIILE
jgi:acetyl-CoA synthetase (ADP-forming)